MRAASAATAARLAASGTITPGARPIAYTVLSEQLLTNASQAGLLSGSAALTTATATAPGGQSSYIHATGNGYSSGSRYAFAFNGPWDFTNAFFRFQLRCQLYGLTQGYFVRFATSKTAHDAGNFLEIKVAPGNAAPNWLFPNTWVYDSFDPLLMTAYGSGAALSSIGCIAFASQDASSSQTCDWDFAKIQRVQKAGTKAKCIIWHDDSVASGFAAIKTKLDAYGWAGSEANEWAGMDTGGTFMGAADLTKAKLSTWSIGTHAASSSEHVAVTATQFANQVLRSRLAARKYGLAGDAADFAYWGNMTANDTVYQDIHPQIQRAYRSGRWNTSKLTQPETQPPGDPHIMKGFLVDSAQTFITNWKPLLDNAVLTKGIAQFVFHQQIGSDSTQAAEFDSMLAWLDANRANIDVLSIDAAVTPLLSGYTPSTAVPTILTLTATPGNAQIVLNRSGGFGDDVALKVYRGATATGTPIATALPFTDTGLINGTAVTYIATATNSAGTVTSATATATPVVPTPPSGTAADNFNRPDSTTSLGTASDGGTWVVQSGTWGISSNQAYDVSGSGAQVVRDLGSANMAVQAKVTGAVVLVARCSNQNNWYGILSNGSALQLYKDVNGSVTNLGSPGSIAAGDTLRIEVSGSTLKVLVNGNVRTTVTDAALSSGTNGGMRSDSTASRFDDFAAAAL